MAAHFNLEEDTLSFANGGNCQQSVNDDNTELHTPALTSKLMADIGFLKEKLVQLEQSNSPNSLMKKNYTDMLKSRESVLHYLERKRATNH